MGTRPQTVQTVEYQTTLDFDVHGFLVARVDTDTPVAAQPLPFGEAGDVRTAPFGDGARVVVSATNAELREQLVAAKLAELVDELDPDLRGWEDDLGDGKHVDV